MAFGFEQVSIEAFDLERSLGFGQGTSPASR